VALFIPNAWQVKGNSWEHSFSVQIDCIGFKMSDLYLETAVESFWNTGQVFDGQSLFTHGLDMTLKYTT
jgi:hypothetical protein